MGGFFIYKNNITNGKNDAIMEKDEKNKVGISGQQVESSQLPVQQSNDSVTSTITGDMNEFINFRDDKLGFELKFPVYCATDTYETEHLYSEGGPAGSYFGVRLGLNKYHDPYWLSVFKIDSISAATTAIQYFDIAHAGDRVGVSETHDVEIGPNKEKFIEIKDKTFFRSFITIKNGTYYEIYAHDSGIESVNNLAEEVLDTFRFVN